MRQAPIADEAALLEQIGLRLEDIDQTSQPVLLSIDGVAGSGKTTLGKRVAACFGGIVVSLDDHLNEHKGTYLPNLRYEDISEILEATSVAGRVQVVEGLYVRSVLRSLGRQPEVSVYVRRVNRSGEWQDESNASETNDRDEVIKNYSALVEAYPDVARSECEEALYHIDEKPLSTADFVFDRVV